MIIRLINCTLLVLFCSTSFAQKLNSFELLGGNSEDEVLEGFIKTGHNIQPTYDGHIVKIRSHSNSGNLDFSCTQYRKTAFRRYSAGQVLIDEWCKPLPNGVNVADYTYPFANGDITYITQASYPFYTDVRRTLIFNKKNSTGINIVKKEFSCKYHNIIIQDVLQDKNGGFLIAAVVYSVICDDVNGLPVDTVKKEGNIWMVKLDSNGNKIWEKIIGGSGMENWAKIIDAPDDGYYMVCNTSSHDYDCKCSGGNRKDIYISRLDNTGNIIWARCMSNGETDVTPTDITEDGTGGIYISSTATSAHKDGHGIHIGGKDFWVMHLDKDNNLLLNKCYGSAKGNEYAYGIGMSEDRTIWMVGTVDTKSGMVDTIYGGTDCWIINIDSTGKLLYSKVIGTPSYDRAVSVHPIENNSVIVSGVYGDPSNVGNIPDTFRGVTDVFIAHFSGRNPNAISGKILLEDNIQFYPNPAQDKLYIKNTAQQESRVQISDINGRAVSDIIIKPGETHVNVGDWPQGVYLIKAVDKDGNSSLNKFIKL